MTNAQTITNATAHLALGRIASTEFEAAFADYSQQRAAFEATSGQPRDWTNGNPLDPLDTAFKRMMDVPAPDLDALIRKMEATTGKTAENCGWETQYYVGQLIADARRLSEAPAKATPHDDALRQLFDAYGLRPFMGRSEAIEQVDLIIEARDYPNRSMGIDDEEITDEEADRMGAESQQVVNAFFASLDRLVAKVA